MTKAVEFFALSIIVFNPIIFSNFFYSSFGIPKLMHLRFFSILILLLFIIKYYFGDIQKEVNKINKISNLPFIFLLFTLLFASLFSISPYLSFFGEYNRFDGYLTTLNYIGVYFIFYLYLSEKKDYEMFISFLIYPSILVIFYGLFQAVHLDLMVWNTEKPDRIFSSLGHPIFLATYLALIYPFALFRFFSSERKRQKIFYFCYLLLSYGAIIFTLSRSGWLAWGVAVVIFFCFVGKEQIKKSIYKIIILFSSIILLTWFLNSPPHSRSFSTVSERAVSTIKIKTDSSIKERWNIYSATLRIVRDYPLLGCGPETLKNIFTKYRDLKFIPVEEANYIADKAHNEFLHIAATSGFLGLFSYLWVYLVVFFIFLHRIKKENDFFRRYFLICCLCSFVGFLAAATFSFGMTTTYTIFYAIIGAGLSIASCELQKERATRRVAPTNLRKIIPFFIVLLFWMYLMIKFVIYPAVADHYYFKAILSSKCKTNFSLIMIKKAQHFNPYESDYLRYSGKLYFHLSSRNKKYIVPAIEAYQRYLIIQPFNTEAHYELGRVLSYIPAKNKDIFQYTLSFYEKAHYLYPEFIPYSLFLVDAYFKYYILYQDRYILNKSYDVLQEVNSKHPEVPSVWYYLGKYFYYTGDISNAEFYFKKAEKKIPDFADYKIWLGNIYLEQKKYKQAISQYKSALKTNPAFVAGIYNQLGITYQKEGKLDKAEESFKKALELEPNYLGAKHNLDKLKSKK